MNSKFDGLRDGFCYVNESYSTLIEEVRVLKEQCKISLKQIHYIRTKKKYRKGTIIAIYSASCSFQINIISVTYKMFHYCYYSHSWSVLLRSLIILLDRSLI